MERSLEDFFAFNKEVAVAFSGGVDSSYLLYAAARHADRVTAYYVHSQFQPGFELDDARSIAEYCGVEMKVIPFDILSDETVRANPADRCYHCKKRIMGAIIEAAAADGYGLVIDGSNASDDPYDRPGARALAEFGIRSPLRECGLEKERIRELAKEAGLRVWDKPAYACLATRIPSGSPITEDALKITEQAEGMLHDMGFRDFRIRFRDGDALIQVTESQHARAVAEYGQIAGMLSGLYGHITIDDHTR